ncbi:MAG: lipopolysaccharide assembly protein LapA domain-containing protein [Nocardioidaceae bacterium]
MDDSHRPEPDASTPEKPSEPPREPQRDPLRRSRASGAWIGVIVFGLALLLLIVFVAQNTQSVSLSFFGWQGTVALAIALLIAAAAGLLIAGAAGSLRIWQLRRRVRQLKKTHEAGPDATQ